MFELFKETELVNNYNNFRKAINVSFDKDERLSSMNKLFDKFEDRLAYTPASSFEHFHNSFPGGWVDHVMRVAQFSMKFYKLYLDIGFNLNDITKENVLFCAFVHDIGKLGNFEHELYEFNPSDWHVKNQGKNYILNPKLQYMDTYTRTLYLLNQFNILYTENELLGIKLIDGLYNEENKKYYMSFDDSQGLKSMLPYILSQAKLAAVRFEYHRCKKTD